MLSVLLNLPDVEKQRYRAERYPRLRVIYQRAIERGEIPRHTDVDLCLDVVSGTSYFALWAKGEVLPLARRYQGIDLLLESLGAGTRRDRPMAR